MKRLATVTSLLLAIGGAAGAQPWYGNGPRPGPVDHGHPYDRGGDEGWRHGDEGIPPEYQHYGHRWRMLATGDTSEGRQFMSFRPGGQRASRLMIAGGRGAPYIDTVIVHFGDGSVGRYDVRQRLRPGETQRLDLGGNRIVLAVEVFAQPDNGSRYAILAAR